MNPTYRILEEYSDHTCYQRFDWDGELRDDCPGCREALLNPCHYCGYGHGYMEHSDWAHKDNCDPNVYWESSVLTISPDVRDNWEVAPHIYEYTIEEELL